MTPQRAFTAEARTRARKAVWRDGAATP